MRGFTQRERARDTVETVAEEMKFVFVTAVVGPQKLAFWCVDLIADGEG